MRVWVVVVVGSLTVCQQRWCLNTAGELELVGLRWVGWAEGAIQRRGAEAGTVARGHHKCPCSLPGCVVWSVRNPELPDVKVPGNPGGLPRPGPGPASWAQPSCSSPAPPHSTAAWDIAQHPGLWFLYTSLCGLCLAMYSYPKINTLGVLFLLYLSSWASPWPTFEGLKGGRGLFCRPWRVGGLLLMMLVLVMWTEVPVIGDNISLVLYKPGAA